MASRRIALEAHQSNTAIQLLRQQPQERVLGLQIRGERREESLVVAILVKPRSNRLGRAKVTLMTVRDPRCGDRIPESCLGEALAPGDRDLADVEKRCDSRTLQGGDEVTETRLLVPHRHQTLHAHPASNFERILPEPLCDAASVLSLESALAGLSANATVQADELSASRFM